MKLPKKFYVARQYRGSEEIIGFMVNADNENTKAYEKKKDSADRWSKNYGGKATLEPIYIDNTPRTGFQMVTNVSRYSTSNVLWRVRHPEGFEFEITSGNMCDLLATNTMINGVFQEELFFTENKMLVNTNTQLFADMLEKQEKEDTQKQAVSELEPGNAIRVKNRSDTDYEDYQYLGKYHVITVGLNTPLHNSAKSSLIHVFEDLSNHEILTKTKIDFEFSRIDFKDIEIDRKEQVKRINNYFRHVYDSSAPYKSKVMYNDKVPVLASDKPFKREDMGVHYDVVNTGNGFVISDHKLYKIEHGGTVYRVFGYTYTSRNYYGRSTYISYKQTSECEKIFMYPVVLNDNGSMEIDVDLSEHYGFSSYRTRTPFRTPGQNYGSKDMLGLDIPSQISVGYYKLKGE